MKNVLVFFGGISPEHEVSVISGLQVVEKIDRNKYVPYPIYIDKRGCFWIIKGLKDRSGFFEKKRDLVLLGRDTRGPFVQQGGVIKSKVYIDGAYLAFHGGVGEGGEFQGMLASLGVPYTSPNCESSVLTMNKCLTKTILMANDLPSVKGVRLASVRVQENIEKVTKEVIESLGLPLITKPAHFGSSIGISVSKTKVQLKKHLLSASMIDSEVLVEVFLKNFVEYNCAVREVSGEVETSEVEKPVARDQILSFADKYQRGSKKSGGMASLQRELPAKISCELKNKLQKLAIKAFLVCRCKGMVRVDFMVTKKGEIFITELNSIPGSMAFYLWEASGISFKQQITDLLEQAILDFKAKENRSIEYETDIVEKFINTSQ